MLGDYLAANSLDADIDIFHSGEELLAAFKPGKYQILFQDIYMEERSLNGIQTAEKIREIDDEISIIFSTTSEAHGVASYKLDAAYYIVKPVEKAEFEKALHKCREQINRYARTIEVTQNRKSVTIRLRDIYYAEVYAHNVLLHTTSGEVKISASLGEVKEKLGGTPFVTCHRSYIVNLSHVDEMLEYDFLMKNGGKVPIGRTYAQDVKEAFERYFWE